MDVKSQASLEVGVEVRASDEDAKKGWWATRNAYVEPHDIDTKRIAIRRIREERALLISTFSYSTGTAL
jgi:hypothetical protein